MCFEVLNSEELKVSSMHYFFLQGLGFDVSVNVVPLLSIDLERVLHVKCAG